jgi:hypothetical protein
VLGSLVGGRADGSKQSDRPASMMATNVDDPAVQSERIEENPLLQKFVFSQPELESLYESIGCSFSLWRHVAQVASQVRSCCDPDSLAASEHEHDLEARILLVPGGETLLESHLEFEFLGPQWGGHRPIDQGFWDAAVRGRTALLEELMEVGTLPMDEP